MPYKRKKNGKVRWHGAVMISGKRKEKVFETKVEALNWEAEMRTAPPVVEEPEIVTVSLVDWLNDYLDYVEPRVSAKTYSEKKGVYKGFIKFAGPDLPVTEITTGMSLDYLQGHFKNRSGHAANKERKNLVAAYNWGIKYRSEDGFEPPNPFELVDLFPHDAVGHYVPPEEDFWKTYEEASAQNKIMLLTFLHTAGRRSEIYRLRWEDVDFTQNRIRLFTRKRKSGALEADWLPMTDKLIKALTEQREFATGEWVFVQTRGHYIGHPFTENRGFPKEICRRAGVKPFGCHGIRGLTASILGRENVPLKVIQEVLRHRNLRTTELYVRGLEPVRPHLSVLEARG